MSDSHSGFRWYALQIRQRGRELTEQMLAAAGYEYFSPCLVTERRWSDRLRRVEVPLFPGYIFSRFDSQRRLPILRMPGVMGIVSTGKRLQEVDAGELEAIRLALCSDLHVEAFPYLLPGERVVIVSGPLTGIEGVLDRVASRNRLWLSVTTLNRSVLVEIDQAQVESMRRKA